MAYFGDLGYPVPVQVQVHEACDFLQATDALQVAFHDPQASQRGAGIQAFNLVNVLTDYLQACECREHVQAQNSIVVCQEHLHAPKLMAGLQQLLLLPSVAFKDSIECCTRCFHENGRYDDPEHIPSLALAGHTVTFFLIKNNRACHHQAKVETTSTGFYYRVANEARKHFTNGSWERLSIYSLQAKSDDCPSR